MEKSLVEVIEECFDIPQEEIMKNPKRRILSNKYKKTAVEFAYFVLKLEEYYNIKCELFYDNFVDSSYEGVRLTIQVCVGYADA